MILAIEWGIPIIINKQDLTLEVFGADYPLFMDRVLGEVQLRDRILEAHRYLYGRKSKLMINGEKWGFQLSSSRLVKRLLFPTLF